MTPATARAFCDALSDRDQARACMKAFVKQAVAEIAAKDEGKDTGTLGFVAEQYVLQCVDTVFAHAESPLERIFVTALLGHAIKNLDPFGLLVTPPMRDAEQDIATARDSIDRLQRAVEVRRVQGDDTSGFAVWEQLQAAIADGSVPPDRAGVEMFYVFNYHLLPLSTSIHLTPQAGFPALMPDGRGARADLLCWCPATPALRVVAECDSYQYHDNHETFDKDRRRSRALQHRGYKVLQFSGGEIFRDPINTSFELYSRLVDEQAAIHTPPAPGPQPCA